MKRLCAGILLLINLFFQSNVMAQSGIITTYAGNGQPGFSGDAGPATAAGINFPYGIFVDANNNLYIGELRNNLVRKVDSEGNIATAVSGLAATADVVVAPDGTIYIAESGANRVRKLDATGDIIPVLNATNPGGLALDKDGNLYIAETGGSSRIMKVDKNGESSVFAGGGSTLGDGEPATQARLGRPVGLAFDKDGNLYIADLDNHRIRKVDTNGIITTVAGNGENGFGPDNEPATTSSINGPQGIAVDNQGNIYIGDTNNHRIRKVNTSGIISTIAGTGTAGFGPDNEPGTQSQISSPIGLAIDTAGNLYFADSGNHRIRRLSGVAEGQVLPGAPIAGTGDGQTQTGMSTATHVDTPEEGVTRIFATEVIAFSSQFSASSFSAQQMIGEPNFFPNSGDNANNWAHTTQDGQREFLEVSFGEPRPIRGVDVYETLTPGSIDSVYARDIEGNWHLLWAGEAQALTGAKVFQVRFDPTSYQVSAIRIAINSPGSVGWNELDAIAIIPSELGQTAGGGGTNGQTPPATGTETTTRTQLPEEVNRIWVSSVVAFSTEFGATHQGVSELIGPPNTFPEHGDLLTAWASRTPDSQREFLIVAYENPTPIRGVDIYETFNAGAVDSVYAIDTNDNLYLLWAGEASAVSGAQILQVRFDPTPFTVKQIRIAMNSAAVLGWNEIDAIGILPSNLGTGPPPQIVGQPQPPAGGTTSPPSTTHVDAPEEGVTRIFAIQVIDFSTEFGNSSYSATQILGEPEKFPQAGDFPTNWAHSTQDGRREFLEVSFGTPTAIRGVDIYEIFTPGAVDSVYARDTDGNLHVLWTGEVQKGLGGAKIFQVRFDPTPYQISAIRITIDSPGVTGWNEYDAIAIIPSELGQTAGGGQVDGGDGQTGGQTGTGGTGGEQQPPPPTAPSGEFVQGPLPAQEGEVLSHRIAGGGTRLDDDILATDVSMRAPGGIAIDATGNVYIAELSNHRVVKVSLDGILTTVAGTRGQNGGEGDGGPATDAKLFGPGGLALGPDGSLYISDTNNNVVRKIDAETGIITRVAGGGGFNFTGDNQPATESGLSPRGIALDSDGNLYIADNRTSNRIRRVDAVTGIITTIAGAGGQPLTNGMLATDANLTSVNDVAIDRVGNIYISENARVLKIDTSGALTTAASGFRNQNIEIDVDNAGNLFISDPSGNQISIVPLNGSMARFAGGGGASDDGILATLLRLNGPTGVAVDADGAVYAGDGIGQIFRFGATPRRRPAGPHIQIPLERLIFDVTSLGTSVQRTFAILSAGSDPLVISGITLTGDEAFGIDLTETTIPSGELLTVEVRFSPVSEGPHDALLGISHNAGGDPIVLGLFGVGGIVTIEPVITTLAGTGEAGFSGDGGLGPFADLNKPQGIAIDGAGNIYFADRLNNRIRKIDPNGVITTFAGNGEDGNAGDGSSATLAQISAPVDLAVDAAGNVYIGDSGRIRKVEVATGIITTIAGRRFGTFTEEGKQATTAALSGPGSVSLDAAGNVYLTDPNGRAIRKVDVQTGIITTVGTFDTAPSDITLDAAGNIYMAQGSLLQKFDIETGMVTTIAGAIGIAAQGDGVPATEINLGSAIGGVVVDRFGALYITVGRLSGTGTVRRIGLDGIITTVAGGGNEPFANGANPTDVRIGAHGVAIDANGVLYVTAEFPQKVYRIGSPGGPSFSGPAIRIPDEPLTFDVLDLGAQAQREFTLTNLGSESLLIAETALDGDGASQFQIGDVPSSIEPGASVTVAVTFSPATSGEHTAILTLSHNAAGSPSQIILTGFGKGGSIPTYTVSTLYEAPEGARLTQVDVDKDGNIYFVDSASNTIQKRGPDGTVSIIAGGGEIHTLIVPFTTPDGSFAATDANLGLATNVSVDAEGNVYTQISKVTWKITPQGQMSRLAGEKGPGVAFNVAGLDGLALNATIPQPGGAGGIAFDGQGNAFIMTGTATRQVLKVDPTGVITNYAGVGERGSAGDGGPATLAQLQGLGEIATDASGNLYISDAERIRKVTPDGMITTIAGGGETVVRSNNVIEESAPATSFRLDDILQLATGPDGSVFFIMALGHTIHQITPDGFLSTIGGQPDRGSAGDGGPALDAQFNRIEGISVDANGNVIIADSGNRRIRKLTPSSAPQAGGGDTGGGDATGGTTTELPSGTRGPVALDLDTTTGDQMVLQTTKTPSAGDNIVVDVVAVSGVNGAIGFQVVLAYDTAQLEWVGFANKDIFGSGAGLPPQVSDGTATVSVAILGGTASKDAGSLGHATFKVLDGFTGETRITLQSASYDAAVDVGPGGAFVVIGGATAAPAIPTDPVERADFSGDGEIGFTDFLSFASAFSKNAGEVGYDERIDLNGDGSVNFPDFLMFASLFGQKVGG